jgi:enoyl-CoA hydratase
MADVWAVHLIASQRSEEPMSEIATGSDELLCQIRDGDIAHVTFNRPHARNALTFAMYDGLADVCRRADEDRSIRAMILTGAGSKAFAAGTDIAQFRTFSTPENALGYEAHMDRVLGALEACRVPTIAAIAGACTGGGAAIAACCDLRIGTQTAKFGFPIARTLGNCLSMSNISRLTALIGPARVKDIIFTARMVEAREALALGLLTELVEDPSALQARADELARTIAGHAPLTLRATKEAVRRLTKRLSREEGEDLILMCYMSQDFREGMEAFLNKRPPQWRGE